MKTVWMLTAQPDRADLHKDVFAEAELPYGCRTFKDAEKVLKKVSANTPDVLLLDEEVSEYGWLAFVQKFRKVNRTATVIVFAEQPDAKAMQNAQYWGVEFHPPEPDYSELIQSIEGVI